MQLPLATLHKRLGTIYKLIILEQPLAYES